MKTTSLTASLALLILSATAAPTQKDGAAAPAVDYSKVDYSNVDWTKVVYPSSAGANLPSYPAPSGGWSSVAYPPGTGAGASGKKDCPAQAPSPFTFTSTYSLTATPGQVVNASNAFTGGLAGVVGYYNLGINSALDYICYDIKLVGFRGDYQSPAKTATHLHQAAAGKAGPPRLAFPNPVVSANDANVRYSRGCLSAPYTTGVLANGTDTGAAFSAAQIERNPAAFFVDVHSSLAVAGAVRAQVA